MAYPKYYITDSTTSSHMTKCFVVFAILRQAILVYHCYHLLSPSARFMPYERHEVVGGDTSEDAQPRREKEVMELLETALSIGEPENSIRRVFTRIIHPLLASP